MASGALAEPKSPDKAVVVNVAVRTVVVRYLSAGM
jgi:hypothetical protein